MRNKRTLQRGLALLLAGGMALSNIGAVPVLAEEYDTAPETVQATPETAAEETPDDAPAEEDTSLPEASPAEEFSAEEATAAPEIAVLADESADGMTELLNEDFSICTDNFGFSDRAEVKDGALVLTNDKTGSATVKKFDNVVAGQSKIHLNFDWQTNHTGKQGKAGMKSN